jgi:spermidine/putrescine transport system permease protein
MIKEAFLGTRDWPFGSMLSIMLTLAVLAVAGAATWLAKQGTARA